MSVGTPRAGDRLAIQSSRITSIKREHVIQCRISEPGGHGKNDLLMHYPSYNEFICIFLGIL